MKNILIKIPLPLLYAAAFGTLIYYAICNYITHEIPSFTVLNVLFVIQSITLIFWSIGVNSFFSYEGNSTKNSDVINVLAFVSEVLFLTLYVALPSIGWMLLLPLAFHSAFVLLLAPKITKVFYARSKWFVVVELLVPIIGITTLTPEMKRWSQSDEARQN